MDQESTAPEMSTGIELPYERQARAGNPMPEGLSAPDKFMYMSLRVLYWSLKRGVISVETATQEKRQLLQQYEELKWQDENWKRWVKTVKDTEAARSEYRKNRTIENADKMLIAFDGIK